MRQLNIVVCKYGLPYTKKHISEVGQVRYQVERMLSQLDVRDASWEARHFDGQVRHMG